MKSRGLKVGSSNQKRGDRRIVYLACPYTDPSSERREERFRAATRAAATLIAQGHIVYSPITMTHPIDIVLAGKSATLGFDFWVKFDEAFMDVCSEMIILKIEGWDISNGIQREMAYFRDQGKLVTFMTDVNQTVSLCHGSGSKVAKVQGS